MNDRGYEFEYCLVPLAYSRQVTRYFDFDLTPEGRLIKVQISRHMMFIPRSLLIILAHEVSHYVSEKPRQRALRAKCCVQLINYAMTMMLVPEDLLQMSGAITQEQFPVLEEYLITTRTRVWEYLQKNVWKRLAGQFSKMKKNYFPRR